MSRAERAFAETAAKADAAFLRASDESAEDADVSSVFLANARGEHSPDTPGISRIAEEVAALKQAVAGLIGRLDADTERRDAKERARAQISRSPAGSTAGSGSERRSVVASPAASPRASDAAEYPATRSHDEAYRAASPRSAKLGESPDAPPASEVSFAFDDDGEARAQASDGTIPKSAFAPAMSPAMSLETDTAFLQTPATSPGGGTPPPFSASPPPRAARRLASSSSVAARSNGSSSSAAAATSAAAAAVLPRRSPASFVARVPIPSTSVPA